MTDRPLLATTTALLTQGRTLDHLSRLLTAGSLFGLLAHAVVNDADPVLVSVALTVATLAGLAQTYYAMRVSFDAALFRQLGEAVPDLGALDSALQRLGLVPVDKAGRSLEARVAGARALFRTQTAMLLVQIAVVLGTALVIVLT